MYCHSWVCLKPTEHSETPQNARKSLWSIGLILVNLYTTQDLCRGRCCMTILSLNVHVAQYKSVLQQS